MNHNFNMEDFPGLAKALKEFDPINNFTWIRDPYFHGVYLFRGRFDNDQRFGLFIYDTNKQEFIEEPAEIDAYNFKSIAEVYKKYPGLRPQK